MRGRPLATVFLLAAAASCAKVAPPPGGPEDRDPPKVLEVVPGRDAFGVAPDSAVTIVFSERPDGRSVMRGLSVFPPVDFRETHWEEGRLRLVADGGWVSGRPTLILVAGSARDRRGNEMGKPFRTRFTTEAAPDSGEVSGRVWPGKEIPRALTMLVAAYPAAAGDTVDPAEDSPVAMADASPSGQYRLNGLDVAGTYRVVAMADRDGDGRPLGREVWAPAPELVTFPSPEEPTVEVTEFLVGTLDSLGTVSGDVTADSGQVAVVVAEAEGTRAVEVLPGGGPFSLSVPTGATYRVAAFLDADGDTLAGEGESRVDLEEPVVLEMTATRDGLTLDLRGLGPEQEADDDDGSGGEGDGS